MQIERLFSRYGKNSQLLTAKNGGNTRNENVISSLSERNVNSIHLNVEVVFIRYCIFSSRKHIGHEIIYEKLELHTMG